ncbi:MAG: FAD-binding oxidoreductase [Bacteroidia bacterium]|nr:FAD-binding oxidoreductase [Bacteroidia bacterium]
MNKDFNHSYWELKRYFRPADLVVAGAGIVGLSTAIAYQLKHKKARVLVLERGVFPEGASTKNAGFACFGSAGELLDDLQNTTHTNEVWDTVKLRWQGLHLLRKRLGDKALDYKAWGGYELFSEQTEWDKVHSALNDLNLKMENTLGLKTCYRPVRAPLNYTKGFKAALLNAHEGQLDTGKMMLALEHLAAKLGINILYNIPVSKILDLSAKVELHTNQGVFSAGKCVVATNGFARQLLHLPEVKPARAQVLLSSPIPGLKIKGSYHFDKGYYYFRNIHNRVLFGGGRHLDFKTEETDRFGLNTAIQKQLQILLKTRLLPGQNFTIDHSWSGIMGLGNEKKPIVKPVSKNVIAAVRMGGMGVAIGSKVGEMAAGLLD